MKKKGGDPRVEKTERRSEDENIKERMVDEIGNGGSNGIRNTDDFGSKPFDEGTNIGTEEGVDGVDKSVVWAESAVADGGESQARPHRVHHVWARSRHHHKSRSILKSKNQIQMQMQKKMQEGKQKATK